MIRRLPMPQLSRALPALLAATALAAAGCGGDEETRGLSQIKSDRLLELLEDAEQQFDAGECEELQTTLTDLATEVNEVESEVDESVRDGLSAETQELVDLASQDCQLVTTETAPPTTVFTEPTTTEETEPTTTEEETTEETEEEPPGQGPDGQGPPGQEEDSESGFKPPEPPEEEPKEEAAVPDDQSSKDRT